MRFSSAFAASPQSGLAWSFFLFPVIESDWQISRIRSRKRLSFRPKACCEVWYLDRIRTAKHTVDGGRGASLEIVRPVSALSIKQLRERMPELRQREQVLRAELQAIADQANDQGPSFVWRRPSPRSSLGYTVLLIG